MTFEELMKDSAFVEQLNTAKDLDEAAAMITAKGFPVTAAQLAAYESELRATNVELDEDALDSVAGGRFCLIAHFAYLVVRTGGGSRQDAKDAYKYWENAMHG